ncbi:MAG: alkaline phosphatase family protein [Acidobacteriota bacterium]
MRTRLAAGCAVLFLAQTACGPSESRARGKRVIVLGIDGMDPQFLERHWDGLPNLDRLRRGGDYKRLATSVPPQSPVAWSSFITGAEPGFHGIYDFIHRDPATRMPFSSMAETVPPKRHLSIGPYRIPLSSGAVRSFRRGRAFWQMLEEHGIPAAVLRMPINFPPVESKGPTLAGMGTPDLRGTLGTFTFYTDDPGEQTRVVPGGRIVRVTRSGSDATLRLEGPENTLLKARPPTEVTLTVHVDPSQPVARFDVDDAQVVLREGEWSEWIPVRFPLIWGIRSVSGIIRIYAQRFRPRFRVYVTPVNIDPSAPALPLSTPASYSRELAEALGPYYTQGIAEDTAALRQGVFSRAEYQAQSRLVAREQLALLQHALDQFGEGLLFFHFMGLDQNSHVLWGRHEDELLETYQLVDRAIGRVMERAAGATLIVMSDHGFAAFDRAVHLNTWLWREGFLALDAPGNASDEELFPHVDWSRTQAYALGLTSLYLNQAGRERDGVVTPGPESEEVIARIKQRLEEYRDPETGKAVVESVHDPRTEWRGSQLAAAPDLIVGYAPGYRGSWQTALGAVPRAVIEDNKDEWAADHCMAASRVPGVFLSNRRSRVADPRLPDVTATVLAEFGVPLPPQMTGRPVF